MSFVALILSSYVCLLSCLAYFIIFIPIDTAFSYDYNDYEGKHLIENYPENNALIATITGSDQTYDIVNPFQLRDRHRIGIDTRNPFYNNLTIYFDTATFVIKTASYGRFRLHVKLNKLLIPPSARFLHVTNDTHRSELSGASVPNCYYQGHIHKEPESRVVLSTCHGLRGVIYRNNDTFVIHHLAGGQLDKKHPHVFYKAHYSPPAHSSSRHGALSCGNSDGGDFSSLHASRQLSKSTRRTRDRRDIGTALKYVELAVVVDQSVTAKFQDNRFAVLSHLLEVGNIVDQLYSDIQTRVALVYAEIWSTTYSPPDGPSIGADLTASLLNVIDHSSRHYYHVPHDALLFLTNAQFNNDEIGMGSSGNICTKRAVGVVQHMRPHEPHFAALGNAHILGHILGMRHDGDRCSCPGSTCVMTDVFPSRSGAYPYQFSTCSVDDYLETLRLKRDRCLLNLPLQPNTLTNCGNKVIDEGEECDCGRPHECDHIDSCCDAVTCKLKAASECATGPCCDNCKLKARGLRCRDADGECDVPEFCDGTVGQCPKDSHKINGVECGTPPGLTTEPVSENNHGARGYCYVGKCHTLDTQCRRVWGSASKASNPVCFEKLNQQGVEGGNCGRRDDGHFLRCSEPNALCGLLQCQFGSEEPILRNFNGVHYKMSYSSRNGSRFQCNAATNAATQFLGDIGLVRDGTRCGSGAVCLGQACVPLSAVTPDAHCPSNNVALQCSGHGVCTNLDTCFCDPGWTGADCSSRHRIPGGSLSPGSSGGSTFVLQAATDGGTMTSYEDTGGVGAGGESTGSTEGGKGSGIKLDLETETMFIILGGVAGCVFLILFLVAVCYRRRASPAFWKKQKLVLSPGGTQRGLAQWDRTSDASASAACTAAAQRSIKFGNMPSYRNEKLARRKQRHLLQQFRGGSGSVDENMELSPPSKLPNDGNHSNESGSDLAVELVAPPRADQQSSNNSSPYDTRGPNVGQEVPTNDPNAAWNEKLNSPNGRLSPGRQLTMATPPKPNSLLPPTSPPKDPLNNSSRLHLSNLFPAMASNDANSGKHNGYGAGDHDDVLEQHYDYQERSAAAVAAMTSASSSLSYFPSLLVSPEQQRKLHLQQLQQQQQHNDQQQQSSQYSQRSNNNFDDSASDFVTGASDYRRLRNRSRDQTQDGPSGHQQGCDALSPLLASRPLVKGLPPTPGRHTSNSSPRTPTSPSQHEILASLQGGYGRKRSGQGGGGNISYANHPHHRRGGAQGKGYGGGGGYESDTYVACGGGGGPSLSRRKDLEESFRLLREYELELGATTAQGPSHQASARANGSSGFGNGFGSSQYQQHELQLPSNTGKLSATVSPFAQRLARPNAPSTSQATDYLQRPTKLQKSASSSNDDEDVSSFGLQNGPAPLKLRNIEFLLRQLNTAATTSALLGGGDPDQPSCSSGELDDIIERQVFTDAADISAVVAQHKHQLLTGDRRGDLTTTTATAVTTRTTLNPAALSLSRTSSGEFSAPEADKYTHSHQPHHMPPACSTGRPPHSDRDLSYDELHRKQYQQQHTPTDEAFEASSATESHDAGDDPGPYLPIPSSSSLSASPPEECGDAPSSRPSTRNQIGNGYFAGKPNDAMYTPDDHHLQALIRQRDHHGHNTTNINAIPSSFSRNTPLTAIPHLVSTTILTSAPNFPPRDSTPTTAATLLNTSSSTNKSVTPQYPCGDDFSPAAIYRQQHQ